MSGNSADKTMRIKMNYKSKCWLLVVKICPQLHGDTTLSHRRANNQLSKRDICVVLYHASEALTHP